MNRHLKVVRSWGRRSLARRPEAEPLGARVLPSVAGGLQDLLRTNPTLGVSPAVAVAPRAQPALVSQGIVPLSGVPALNSLPGAAASLYLDFDGFFEAQWGDYRNITTPAFDQDGDTSSFSLGELAAIQRIWSHVAEDFAPFRLNVTTVQPPNFANGVAERVAIGGDGAWLGFAAGGVSYLDSFTNAISNTAYVFPKNLDNGNARYTAEAVSHEAGHAFGLQHQSQYDFYGNKIAEYYPGPGDGRAPIMGLSYYATRGLWWYGTSSRSFRDFQDDMALLARPANGFGYRPDDHGNTAATATALAVSANQLSGSGIVTTTSDLDVFSFSTGAGTVRVSVEVPEGINNLDSRLELRDASGGTLIASAAPADGFGATVTATVAAGSYRLVVASQGRYGDVGQYTVRGTIATANTTIAAPANLTATAISTAQVNLAWTDNATNETGYRVERSTNGPAWVFLATTAANATAYADTTAAPGTAYQYRVSAFNDATTSAPSNVAGATTVPVAPAGLTATAVSSGQINLSWGNVAGETGFRIERSTDGVSWNLAGTTGANVVTFQDTGRTASTTYQYRVQATNAGGASASSNLAAATTLPAPTLPAAPSNLRARVEGSKDVDVQLSWKDNAINESGFRVERSSNGGASWIEIDEVGPNETLSLDGVTWGRTYHYRVSAFNSSGSSPYSNVVRVSVPRRPSDRDPLDRDVDSYKAGLLGTGTLSPSGVNSSAWLGDLPDARDIDRSIDEWIPFTGPEARLRTRVATA